MKTKSVLLITILVFLVTIFISCNSFLGKRKHLKFVKEFTIDTSGLTYMFVSNTNGNISVSTSLVDSLIRITVSGEAFSKIKNSLDSLDLKNFCKIDTTNSTLSIFEPISGKGVNFNISVPSSLKLHLENKNGNVKIENAIGNVNAQTVNGNIYLTVLSGTASAKTTNGNIEAELDSVTTSTFETVNGKIEISLLQHFSGKIIASYVNGKVINKNVDFEKVESERNKYFAVLGKGISEVGVKAVNGKIYIKKK